MIGTNFSIYGGLDSLEIRSQPIASGLTMVTIDTPRAYNGHLVISGSTEELRRFGQRIIEQAAMAESRPRLEVGR